MAIGIKQTFAVAANIVVTSSIVPVTTGLTSPIAAGETQQLTFFVPFTVGATGGVRAIVNVPAGGTSYLLGATIVNTVTDAIFAETQVAAAAVVNALASAGTHWIAINARIVNGLTAGNVDLAMAQNSSDVLSLTILAGGFVDITKL